MDFDLIWKRIDEGRLRFAEVFESLTPEQLATASLCEGWTVRDVGAHLAMAHVGVRDVLWPLVASGFSFDRMTRRTAVASPLTPAEIADTLRGFVGSRRTAVGVKPTEPLIDVLVHTADVAIPLGLELPMPRDAAVIAVERTFTLPGPMRFAPRHDDLSFEATDVDWRHGTSARVVRGPISDLLLVLTGRPAGLPRLTGAVASL